MAGGPGFCDLPGWAEDDHAAALAAFCVTRDLWSEAPQTPIGGVAKAFFEAHFHPAAIATPARLTGYYEPAVPGAQAPSARFAHPLYAAPAGLAPGKPWLTRAEIAATGALAGLELVWLETAIEAFLAQVQGSVRVMLEGGGSLRLGFAGKNGHPYRSIGAALIHRGAIEAGQMSAQAIRDWCAAHPAQVADLLNENPSFVFFRPLDLPEGTGPQGAMGRPLTALRSLAVDPAHVPLGAPVWVACPGLPPRLMIAQDTGSAIRGAGRGDIFFGTGAAAGARAGALNAMGQIRVLHPKAAT